METRQSGIKWTSVVWAALLMFVIPMLAYILIPTLYATYVGFSSRGDPAQINAAVQAIGGSIVYKVIVYAAFAAAALWRSLVLVKKVAGQPLRVMHVGIAVVIAAVLVFAFFIFASGGASGAILDALIYSVLIAGGAFLSTLLKPGKTAQA